MTQLQRVAVVLLKVVGQRHHLVVLACLVALDRGQSELTGLV